MTKPERGKLFYVPQVRKPHCAVVISGFVECVISFEPLPGVRFSKLLALAMQLSTFGKRTPDQYKSQLIQLSWSESMVPDLCISEAIHDAGLLEGPGDLSRQP